MKVIVVEGSSPAEIDAKIKEQGLDGPDVLIIEKVLTKHGPRPIPVDDQGEGKPS